MNVITNELSNKIMSQISNNLTSITNVRLAEDSKFEYLFSFKGARFSVTKRTAEPIVSSLGTRYNLVFHYSDECHYQIFPSGESGVNFGDSEKVSIIFYYCVERDVNSKLGDSFYV